MATGSGHRIDVAEPGHGSRDLVVPGRSEPGDLSLRPLRLVAALALLLIGSGASASGTPGKFDYWVLSLSWSPQYCASTKHDDVQQCGSDKTYGFVVHGLWPQFERGFPSNCTKAPYLPQPVIDSLLPIMPSKGLILHEWKTHGTCSGLDAETYAAKIESVYRSIHIPERYQQIDTPLSVKPSALEGELISANPLLKPDGISLECRGAYLSEVRICLDTAGQPRSCGPELRDQCGKTATFRPTRAAN